MDRHQRARRWIAVGAVVTAVGLAVAATAPVIGTQALARIQMQQSCGGALVVIGWVLLAFGIHRLGRSSASGGAPDGKTG